MQTSAKTEQLQVRVSPHEKSAIRRAAKAAGQDLSTYILSRVLSDAAREFRERLTALSKTDQPRFELAELNTHLSRWTAGELTRAVAADPAVALAPFLANYVAAMVESVCARHSIPAPAWTLSVPPLAEPVFGSQLESLRLHLLTHSPAPFRRRNLFIDSSVGARV